MPGRTSALLFPALVTLAAGCSRSEAPPAEAKASAPRPAATRPAPAKPAPSDDPADALNRFVADLAAGRGDGVAAALPERYRRDLDRFLAETVRPIDPALRRRAADALARFADAVREKGAFVLASKRVEIGGPAGAFLREHLDGCCRLAAAVARWPGWAEADAGSAESLVAAVASALAGDKTFADALRGARIETISRDGDRATVRVRRDAEPAEVPLRRIDGTWVPAALADRWEQSFATDESAAPSPAETSQRLARLADRLDETAAALKGVSTQAEFDALADRAATLLLATAAQAAEGPRAVREDEFVTVVVLGRMTEEQKDRLLWDFAAQADAPASGLADAADRAEGDGINVTVGPVADVEAFAKRLPGVTVERIDREKKAVTARFAGR